MNEDANNHSQLSTTIMDQFCGLCVVAAFATGNASSAAGNLSNADINVTGKGPLSALVGFFGSNGEQGMSAVRSATAARNQLPAVLVY